MAELLKLLEERNMSNYSIIIDNLRVHKVTAIKELIECKAHSLHFLPPYSPQLSPIEECFSKWKAIIKARSPDNTEDLHESINVAHEAITADNCVSFSNHAREFAVKALRNEHF